MSERADSRLEPDAPRPPARSGSRPNGPSGSRATGRSAARPARASTCASSTAASTATIRSSAALDERRRGRTSRASETTIVPGRARRRLRPRHGLRRHRPRARPGLPAAQRPRPRRGQHGQRRSDPRRPPPRDRARLRRRQPQPLDDEAQASRSCSTSSPTAPTSRGTVLVASAHNMPVESYPWRFSSVISVGSHEGTDSRRVVRESRPAGRVLRPRDRRRRGLVGGRHAPVHGQQLRRAPHRRALGARALEAPRPDAVPAQERPLPDGGEHGRHHMTDETGYQEAVAAGNAPVRGEPPRAPAVDRRRRAGDLRREGVVDLPARPRRPTSSSSRPSRARARAT